MNTFLSSNEMDDIFGSFASAAPAANISPTEQPAEAAGAGGKKTNADILALFGSAPAPQMNSQFGGMANFGGAPQQGQFGQAPPAQNGQFGGQTSNQFAGFQQMPQQQQQGQMNQFAGMVGGSGQQQPQMQQQQGQMNQFAGMMSGLGQQQPQMQQQPPQQHNQAAFMAANPFMNNGMFQQQQQVPPQQNNSMGGWGQQMGQVE